VGLVFKWNPPKEARKVSKEKNPEKKKDVSIPIPVSGPNGSQGETMSQLTVSGGTLDSAVSLADVPANVHQQCLARLSSAGATAHEHFVTFNKILDLNYEADRKMVSLTQALGVREVTSQAGQLGIPNAAQQGSAAGAVK